MSMLLAPKTVRLGLMPPLTGVVGLYGPEITWAAEIACAEINARGGLLGRPLELIIADDGSLPETAVPAAERLIDVDGCTAIIGNLLSNARIAVATRVTAPRRVPQLNFSFYEGSIAGRYFFHFAALPNQQIDKMIPYMASRFGQKMFFVGNNYEWPRGSIHAAKKVLRGLDGEVVGERYLPFGLTPSDLDPVLEEIARSGADVVVPYFAGSDQTLFLTRFTEQGLKKRMAVVMGHYDEAMVSGLSPEIRAGFYACNTYFMSVDTPENQAYLEKLAALPDVTGLWPNGNGIVTHFGESAYLCVHAFAQAVEQAQSTAADDLVTALESIILTGPQGVVKMDAATHHASVNTYLTRCEADGTFTLIESFGCNRPHIPKRYRYQPTALITAPTPASEMPTERRVQYQHYAYETQPTVVEASLSQQILAAADIAIIAYDHEGIVLQTNLRADQLFGYDAGELIGLSVHLLVPPQYRQRHTMELQRFLSSVKTTIPMMSHPESVGYRKDGSFFPLKVTLTRFQNHGEWVIVSSLIDASAARQAEEEQSRRATHDPITGLPNRSLFRERLNSALHRSKRHGYQVGLLFIDLDGFKLINESYGHKVGDQLLVSIANRLIEHVRPGDTVSHLGSDEFVVLCEQVEEPMALSSLAERLNEALRGLVPIAEHTLYISASIGIAMGNGIHLSTDTLLRHADAAMDSVKRRGRNGWQFFNENLHEQAARQVAIATGLRRALERNELHLLCQPIVATATGAIRGAEVLLRWTPESGMVSPAVFIPIAEMTGSILPIGLWVFEQACRMEADWRRLFGDRAPYVSVNLSTRQLDDPHLARQFIAVINQYNTQTDRILLEVTETSLMSDVETNLRVLQELADLGLRVAVDDFGTGYSSLSQLLRLPVQTIKIDREFIDGLDKRPQSRAIVSAVVGMAKDLGLKTIAEGVETVDQLTELQALECDYIQGFYFYRPMPEAALMAAVEERIRRSRRTLNMPIHFVLYVSEVLQPPSKEELAALVHHTQIFNSENGITGCLLYQRSQYMQILEGRKDTILALIARIQSDPRHLNVRIIMSGDSQKRTFPDASMGFRDLSALDQGRFEESTTFAFQFTDLAKDPTLCYALMTTGRTL